MHIPCWGAARSRAGEQQAPAAITQLWQNGVGRDPGTQDPDGRTGGPVLVVTAGGGVLVNRPDVIHQHVGCAQVGDRGVQRGAQVIGVRGVRDVAATGLASGSKLGDVGVQPRLVDVEHGDRVSGIGECADECGAEARSDADDYCGSEGHDGPFFDGGGNHVVGRPG